MDTPGPLQSKPNFIRHINDKIQNCAIYREVSKTVILYFTLHVSSNLLK